MTSSLDLGVLAWFDWDLETAHRIPAECQAQHLYQQPCHLLPSRLGQPGSTARTRFIRGVTRQSLPVPNNTTHVWRCGCLVFTWPTSCSSTWTRKLLVDMSLVAAPTDQSCILLAACHAVTNKPVTSPSWQTCDCLPSIKAMNRRMSVPCCLQHSTDVDHYQAWDSAKSTGKLWVGGSLLIAYESRQVSTRKVACWQQVVHSSPAGMHVVQPRLKSCLAAVICRQGRCLPRCAHRCRTLWPLHQQRQCIRCVLPAHLHHAPCMPQPSCVNRRPPPTSPPPRHRRRSLKPSETPLSRPLLLARLRSFRETTGTTKTSESAEHHACSSIEAEVSRPGRSASWQQAQSRTGGRSELRCSAEPAPAVGGH